MKKIYLLLILSFFTFASCDVLNEAAKMVVPTDEEMTAALRQALEYGTNDAVSFLSKEGGYLDNARFKIPFPPDVQNVANKLRDLGFGSLVDEFITRMNRGAEDAAKEAAPIFVAAIKEMTIADAKNIVLGNRDAATQYFIGKTRDKLYGSFSPKIKSSLDKFEVTKYWTDITSTYNKIPFVKPVETDLVKYATNKALDGLFIKVAEEESEIRDNVSARVTPVLKKVFGWADMQKAG